METAQSGADAHAVVPLDAAALVSALGGGLPDGRLVVDRDVLAAMSHDDAEWAPVGRFAGLSSFGGAPRRSRR
jgi:glycolate oxidase